MLTTKIFPSLVFYFLLITTIKAQTNTSFLEKIEISSNYPTSVIQDSKGFIWVGTNNGLNRYDGYRSKVYKYDAKKSNTISNDWITSLLEDSHGNIWIGTDGGGLNYYNTTTGVITRWKQPNECEKCIYSVNGIIEDHKGNLWIGDEYYGLYYFNISNGKFTKPHLKYSGKNKLPSKFINDLYYSKENRRYFYMENL